MTTPGSQLGRRFRVRSPREIGERARQRIHIWLELFAGRSRGGEPSDEFLTRVLRPEREPIGSRFLDSGTVQPDGVFAGLSDGAGVGAMTRARYPEVSAQIIACADRAVTDRFDLLGHEGLSYGAPIDWHLDPLRGRRAPLVHWSRVPFLDVEQIGDHKVIWELNRHQHLVTLGQAYCLTADERYPATLVRHMSEWMNANPPKLGINWSSSLELSFRAISWIWALNLVRGSGALSLTFVQRAMKFLYLHARHIAAHLSTYFSPNTHLTGEALGLLYIGTCFEEFVESARWRALGWSILERELERQIRPDGIYFEQTTWYQRYTADFYLHALQLRERSGHAVAEHTRRRMSQIIDPLVHFTEPGGLTPLLGDDDGGQLLPLRPGAAGDFRPTLAHAAVLFGRTDCAALSMDGASVLPWLVGATGSAAFEEMERRPPASTGRLFPDGGYFAVRDRWTADADFLVVDCGPHGSLSCGHAHADALSFVLTLGGARVLVDPGTFSYAQPQRNQFRTTAAHNTLTIDDVPSSEPDRPFRWKSAANCFLSTAVADERLAFFHGVHDGYMRLADPVRHRRAILALFGEFVVVRDTIEASGTHDVVGRFHFNPSLTLSKISDRGLTISTLGSPAERLADIFFVGENIAVSVEAARVAPIYGAAVDAQVGTFRSCGTGTRTFWTVLVASRRAAGDPIVRTTAAGQGCEIVLRTGGYEDSIAAGDHGLRLGELTTDAHWLWIRRTVPQGRATEFMVIGGAELSIDGEAIVSLPSRREYIRGHRLESGWELHMSPA